MKHINNLGKSIEVKPQKKWEDVFDIIDWKKTYNTVINCTIDTKIRYFQYKFLMRILPSNRFLLKCKLVNSSLCDFCAMHEETIIHLFWECSLSRDFWNKIECFLIGRGFDISLNYKLISHCTPDLNKKESQIVSFILILAKYFIFSNKYKKSIPNFNIFKLFLERREHLEKIIALKKDKLAIHNEKWSRIL